MDLIPFHIVKEHFAELLRWEGSPAAAPPFKAVSAATCCSWQCPGEFWASPETPQGLWATCASVQSFSESKVFFLTFKLNFLYLNMCQMPLVLSLSTTKSLLKTAPSVPGMSHQWWRRWRITSLNLLAMCCLMRRRHTGNTTLAKYVHSNTFGLFFPVRKTVSIFFCSFSI